MQIGMSITTASVKSQTFSAGPERKLNERRLLTDAPNRTTTEKLSCPDRQVSGQKSGKLTFKARAATMAVFANKAAV